MQVSKLDSLLHSFNILAPSSSAVLKLLVLKLTVLGVNMWVCESSSSSSASVMVLSPVLRYDSDGVATALQGGDIDGVATALQGGES